MKSHLTRLLLIAELVEMGGAADAHHYFAMFDQENPIEINCVVNEWKYTAPHDFNILEVKEADSTSGYGTSKAMRQTHWRATGGPARPCSRATS